MPATRRRKPTTATTPTAPPIDPPTERHPWNLLDPTEDLTVGDRLRDLMLIGTELDHAAASVGVFVSTIRRWMRDGLATLARFDAGTNWQAFTYDDQRLAVWAHAMLKAEGEWIVRANGALEELARGKTTTTTRRKLVMLPDPNDATRMVQQEVERTVEVAEGRPDARVIMWRFERKFPELYGPRATVRLLTDDTADDDSTMARLEARLEQVLQATPFHSGAIDATSHD